MGYESRIIIGKPHLAVPADMPQTISIVADLRLSKIGFNPKDAADTTDTRTYGLFAEDGDTVIAEDRYGDRIFAIDPEAFLALVDKEEDASGPYRRFDLVRAVINQMTDISKWSNDIVFLHYGY